MSLQNYISTLYSELMHSAPNTPEAPDDPPASADPAHPSSQRPLANQIVASASRFARVVTQVSDIPISAVSMRALGYIERLGPQRVSTMAVYESISQPAMTSAVNRLAEDGLVVRQTDPADARAQLVAMTDTGRELLEQYRQQVADVLQPRLENLTPEDYATIERCVELLDSLTDDLTGLA